MPQSTHVSSSTVELTSISPLPKSNSVWRVCARSPRIVFGLSVLMLVILAAAFAGVLAPYAPNEMDITMRLLPPSMSHWLGCDVHGADILTAMLYGARTSLYVSFLTVFLCMTIGTTAGLVSGYKGGWIDTVLMRFVDVLMAFPGILLALALAAMLGPSINNIVLAITATGWTSTARLVRGQVLSFREREFVLAAKTIGATTPRILFLHILPSLWTPIVVQSTFSLSGVILVEASLSFLGLGAQNGPPTWGALLSQGRSYLAEAPHLAIVPGLAVITLVLALNFLGDAFRDLLDPRGAG
jgi:peptide/nickel transport system permease protein